jgi:hypothetical protein
MGTSDRDTSDLISDVRDEGSKVEVLRAGKQMDWGGGPIGESQDTPSTGLRFHALLTEGGDRMVQLNSA